MANERILNNIVIGSVAEGMFSCYYSTSRSPSVGLQVQSQSLSIAFNARHGDRPLGGGSDSITVAFDVQ
jgi:hypothetical protein